MVKTQDIGYPFRMYTSRGPNSGHYNAKKYPIPDLGAIQLWFINFFVYMSYIIQRLKNTRIYLATGKLAVSAMIKIYVLGINIVVIHHKFLFQTHSRPNKPKYWSLDQRKVYCRARQREQVVPGQTMCTLRWFSGVRKKVF